MSWIWKTWETGMRDMRPYFIKSIFIFISTINTFNLKPSSKLTWIIRDDIWIFGLAQTNLNQSGAIVSKAYLNFAIQTFKSFPGQMRKLNARTWDKLCTLVVVIFNFISANHLKWECKSESAFLHHPFKLVPKATSNKITTFYQIDFRSHFQHSINDIWKY